MGEVKSGGRFVKGQLGKNQMLKGLATDCSLPGSAVHGIFQARVLEWGAIAFSDTHTAIYEINKDLLYSTGNYIQHFIINHNEKEYIRACV